MSSDHDQETSWTAKASNLLGVAESGVLTLIGVALILVAVLLLYSGLDDLWGAVNGGVDAIEKRSIDILNTVLLVMMTMEIVYTVAISLKSHVLDAEPFLIIGTIAGIRRMLVITATSTDSEHHPEEFRNTLIELGLLTFTVVALALSIWILRSKRHAAAATAAHAEKPASPPAVTPISSGHAGH